MAGPSGQFTQISAGDDWACGIRRTGAAACWGDSAQKVPAPPAIRLIQISVGSSIACGLEANRAAVCWDARVRVPSGQFASVSAGDGAACGVRRNGAIICWGPISGDLRSHIPAGRFRWASVGTRYACGTRTSGAIICWDYDLFADAYGPAGDFTEVKTGNGQTCGLRHDGSAVCFSSGSPPTFTLAGRYIDINASRESIGDWCRVGTVRCWGITAPTPSGRFRQVSAGTGSACGVLLGRRAKCWGSNNHGQSRPPQNQLFLYVSVGIDDACGVTVSKVVVCWGDRRNPATRPHTGRFVEVELMPSFERGGSEDYACGLRVSGRIDCWGFPIGTLVPPAGGFVRWSLGLGTLCGVDRGGGMACQGNVTMIVPHRP
ncbi:MAG TPA: RCC1 domain-containing protein [Chloroflexota bacterium]|nr:RCC1 domain-containing protein [Chloroflexota bacterium]